MARRPKPVPPKTPAQILAYAQERLAGLKAARARRAEDLKVLEQNAENARGDLADYDDEIVVVEREIKAIEPTVPVERSR